MKNASFSRDHKLQHLSPHYSGDLVMRKGHLKLHTFLTSQIFTICTKTDRKASIYQCNVVCRMSSTGEKKENKSDWEEKFMEF